MKKKRIWLVSEVFYPDTDIATANIATEIALRLSEQFEVHVICGPKDYERKNKPGVSDTLANIQIHRSRYFNFDKNHKIKRLVRVVGISIGLFIHGFKIQKEDKAFVISNPAFITPLFGFLKWVKGFEYFLLMHDVFPENLIVGGYVKESNLFYQLLNRVFAQSRKAADKIIVIGRDMKTLMLRHFPTSRKEDIVVIPNWADPETVYPVQSDTNPIWDKLNIQNKVVVLFAGNHGILQNLLQVLKIVQQSNNPQVHYIFAGGGATKDELEHFVSISNMDNVSFLPAFSRSENNNILNACHIGLVSLTDKLYGVGVPSKSYNILSAGKPILFLGNTQTEIAQFVLENDLGWAFECQNDNAILQFFNTLKVNAIPQFEEKGRKGRAIVEKSYSKQFILNQINTLIGG